MANVDASQGAAGDSGDHANGEAKHEKLTRNLNELLQELRVMQTGAQILTGFLLTVPFTSRFTDSTRPRSGSTSPSSAGRWSRPP